jgi:hypothetical protein
MQHDPTYNAVTPAAKVVEAMEALLDEWDRGRALAASAFGSEDQRQAMWDYRAAKDRVANALDALKAGEAAAEASPR